MRRLGVKEVEEECSFIHSQVERGNSCACDMAVKTLPSVEDVLSAREEYLNPEPTAPKLTGFGLKAFVWAIEIETISRPILGSILKDNKTLEIIRETIIPDEPMFYLEYPAQKIKEAEVLLLEEESSSVARVEIAVDSLPPPVSSFKEKLSSDYPFLYWTIRDYAAAYSSGHVTPSEVAERFITVIEQSEKSTPRMGYLISFKPDDIRKQAEASTQRHAQGKPLSVLDGILFAVKDDIDCFPHPSTGGTKWLHRYREVKEDAECVSKLRKAGVVFVGKANMNELGLGVTGHNTHYGVVRNPHDTGCHTGGSSAGSCALVAAGLCSGALGTDVGGSIRIPSGLCGTVGLKVTVGRTTLKGISGVSWTMESVGPITANVEDLILLYSAYLGSLPTDQLISGPLPPCLPNIKENPRSTLQQLKLGKFSAWFKDTLQAEVAEVCERSLKLLFEGYGTETEEIFLPELQELRNGHLVTVAGEYATTLRPYYPHVKKEMGLEPRSNLALFYHFSTHDYVAGQQLRRRQMHYHMEAFKTVDIIVTPTTAMTAPAIGAGSAKLGESDLVKAGNLMRFILAGNFLGLPCLSVPVGHDSKGLPIGLQLIGRPWEEATLLRVAAAIEEVCLPHRQRPKVFHDLLK
ncbi:hypothetical protein R1flu_001297 [Riccia fluitans]|uniref:Amidase domain-containing protein n=1 Tax=Riccia fluitans TaxID=41844 RepID=A0ABD1Y644_9MARC